MDGVFAEFMSWDPDRKSIHVILDDENQTATCSEGITVHWVVAKQGFNIGKHSWKLECDRGLGRGQTVGIVS